MNIATKTIWQKIREHPLTVILFAVRWFVVLASAVLSSLYIVYEIGSDIAAEVSADFISVEEHQRLLLDDLTTLSNGLLDTNLPLDLNGELVEVAELSQNTLLVLGRMKAPTRGLENARHEYRLSLEALIGVSSRIRREGAENMALPLHNAMQKVSNSAGNLRSAVEHFLGGAWPKLWGSFF